MMYERKKKTGWFSVVNGVREYWTVIVRLGIFSSTGVNITFICDVDPISVISSLVNILISQ